MGVTEAFNIRGLHHLTSLQSWWPGWRRQHRHRPWGRVGEEGRAERRETLKVGMRGDCSVGEKGVVPVRHHKRSETSHDGLRLQVEVAEHFVGAPPTKQADEIGVDASDEESHGAGGAKAFRRYIGGKETNTVRADERDSSAESGGNVGRKHREPVPVAEVGSEGLGM